jgi:hypothetical protein
MKLIARVAILVNLPIFRMIGVAVRRHRRSLQDYLRKDTYIR